MKLQTIAKRVKTKLEEYPYFRDCDNRLITAIWADTLQDMGYNLYRLNAIELFRIYSESMLPSAESIRRSRQKLQQENPDLRGGAYKHKQTTAVEETRCELKLLEQE